MQYIANSTNILYVTCMIKAKYPLTKVCRHDLVKIKVVVKSTQTSKAAETHFRDATRKAIIVDLLSGWGWQSGEWRE